MSASSSSTSGFYEDPHRAHARFRQLLPHPLPHPRPFSMRPNRHASPVFKSALKGRANYENIDDLDSGSSMEERHRLSQHRHRSVSIMSKTLQHPNHHQRHVTQSRDRNQNRLPAPIRMRSPASSEPNIPQLSNEPRTPRSSKSKRRESTPRKNSARASIVSM